MVSALMPLRATDGDLIEPSSNQALTCRILEGARWNFTRTSPSLRQGYVSWSRYFWASVSMCLSASVPASTSTTLPLSSAYS